MHAQITVELRVLLHRNGIERWTFKDGIYVDEELENIELERIRAVCNQQCRTRWTSIASRDRLYQFMAMSDEETQNAMQLKVSSTDDIEQIERAPGSANAFAEYLALNGSLRPRGSKR